MAGASLAIRGPATRDRIKTDPHARAAPRLAELGLEGAFVVHEDRGLAAAGLRVEARGEVLQVAGRWLETRTTTTPGATDAGATPPARLPARTRYCPGTHACQKALPAIQVPAFPAAPGFCPDCSGAVGEATTAFHDAPSMRNAVPPAAFDAASPGL